MALPNPSLEPRTQRWHPGQVGRCPPKTAHDLPQNRLFLAPKGLGTHSTRTNKGKWLLQSRCQLTSPCQRDLWCPLTPQHVRETPQKGLKKPLNLRTLATNGPNQDRAVSWATWLKSKFQGHLVHLRPPSFCGFQASNSPNETPRPLYRWSLGGAREQHGSSIFGPLPLNLASNKQHHQQQQATTSTSPFRFGYCSVSSLRALFYSSHVPHCHMAFPNPKFEAPTHRWHPRA